MSVMGFSQAFFSDVRLYFSKCSDFHVEESAEILGLSGKVETLVTSQRFPVTIHKSKPSLWLPKRPFLIVTHL